MKFTICTCPKCGDLVHFTGISFFHKKCGVQFVAAEKQPAKFKKAA